MVWIFCSVEQQELQKLKCDILQCRTARAAEASVVHNSVCMLIIVHVYTVMSFILSGLTAAAVYCSRVYQVPSAEK